MSPETLIKSYMEFKKVLIDTSYIVSLCLPNDSRHEEACRFLIDISKCKLYITNLIYMEYATVLSQKLSKQGFGRSVKELTINTDLEEIFIERELYARVKRAFALIREKDISFVDLSSAIVAKKYKIPTILTFDKHFLKLGKSYGLNVLGV